MNNMCIFSSIRYRGCIVNYIKQFSNHIGNKYIIIMDYSRVEYTRDTSCLLCTREK